ncbi:hypothetical protein EPI10_024031 [Gossypium australe]|uniref:Uncharacterized protein n=1 Tax=Gossypium australe TaxID=47621 RepID=A0A5B6VVV1_9ROSI|nr:hypothetical protein EPI10_024031 [Gossypium australe]
MYRSRTEENRLRSSKVKSCRITESDRISKFRGHQSYERLRNRRGSSPHYNTQLWLWNGHDNGKYGWMDAIMDWEDCG